jgi:ribosomal protein S18 acetylase RimI-like enzyme
MATEQVSTENANRLSIRRYVPADRTSIRQLAVTRADQRVIPACLSARSGLVADILTRYYTDVEPESCLVVDDPDDGVVGHLLGCLSTARRLRAMACRVVPAFIVQATLSGVAFSCPVGRLARAGLSTWKSGHAVKSGAESDYPAHLHISVREEYRRRGLGKELVRRFLAQASAAGIPGVHVSVVKGNARGQAFFQSLGFNVLGQYEAFFPGSWTHVGMVLLGKLMPPARNLQSERQSPSRERAVDE